MFFNPAELAPPANFANLLISDATDSPKNCGDAESSESTPSANFANLLICEDSAPAEISKFAELAAPPANENDSANAAKLANSQNSQNSQPLAAAGALTPDDLAIAHALLTHWQEGDPDTRREWLDGLARDPARLEGMRQMALAAGVARHEPAPTTELEGEPRPMAVCARCRHWTPDTINPTGGRGRCLCDAPASRRPGSCWPWTHEEAALTCNAFDPKTPHEEPR